MESKLLRKLAKVAGFAPQNVYRQRPADLQEMLKEKWPDIDEWDAAKATEVIEAAAADASPPAKEAPEPPASEEPKKKVKRVRRTKAQIEADRKAKEEAAAEAKEPEKKKEATKPAKPVKQTETTSSTKELPRRRRKKRDPAQNSVENVLLGKLALLDERLTNIEAALANQRPASGGTAQDDAVLKDIAAFLAWFHNTVDSSDPITSLSEVDWADCIDAQQKN